MHRRATAIRAVLVLFVCVIAGCTASELDEPAPTAQPSVPGTMTSTLSSAQPLTDLEPARAQDVAESACRELVAWMNTAAAEMNEASTQAADARTPVQVREAFLEAIASVEGLLNEWPDAVASSISGAEGAVATLRSDLVDRSAEAREVLAAMVEEISMWPDDDTETRNARTQQAFIRFEGVIAEMKPDLPPYEGTTLGRAIAQADECELVFRP